MFSGLFVRISGRDALRCPVYKGSGAPTLKRLKYAGWRAALPKRSWINDFRTDARICPIYTGLRELVGRSVPVYVF